MDSEEVCLKWSNFSSNITRNIDELWKDESLVDVTICSEGQCIQAHKVILSASSPLFKGIFAVNPCQHPVVILQDVKYRELSTIIKFIYKGEVNIDQQYLPELLKAAKTLQIRGLSDSVSTLNHEEYSLPTEPLNHQPQSAKKRKADIENEYEHSDDMCNQPMIIPKQEMEMNEFIPPDIETQLTDEEDVKDLRLEGNLSENPQLMITPPENHESVWMCDKTGSFLCPFCTRSYTCWGYRRRHIKARHGDQRHISCRWCPECKGLTQDAWLTHSTSHHALPHADAQHALHVLDEAIKVLHTRNASPPHNSILGN